MLMEGGEREDVEGICSCIVVQNGVYVTHMGGFPSYLNP